LTACDNGIVGTGENAKGIAQKGPFVVGSEVVIHERAAPDYKESAVYREKITHPLGLFDFNFKTNTFYDIEVSGKFFDEVKGGISPEPLTLIANYFHRQESNQPVSINLLTHIIHKRIDFFIANGDAPEQAMQKANSELQTQLETALLPQHLDKLDINHVSLYNFDAGSDEKGNAVLLFASASFMQASQMYPAFPSLQVLVDQLAGEMESLGVIDNNNISILDIAAKSLNADKIEENLLAYSSKFSEYNVSVPNIRWLLDNDGDGIRNDVDVDDDGDNINDIVDPHPYDFEIVPLPQTITVANNTTTTLGLSYPSFSFVCNWDLFSAPQHGNLVGLDYLPTGNFVGQDQFQFTISCILANTEQYTSPPFTVYLDVVDATAAPTTPL